MTINVDDVCTDADLEAYTLGKTNLQKLLPDEWLADPDEPYDADDNVKSAAIPRQTALDDALHGLRRRRPPITAEMLTDVTQLKTAVCMGALAIIYGGANQHEDSPNAERAKHFAKRFTEALAGLQPDIQAGVTAASLSIRISRG